MVFKLDFGMGSCNEKQDIVSYSKNDFKSRVRTSLEIIE